jgi:hypothetical protein
VAGFVVRAGSIIQRTTAAAVNPAPNCAIQYRAASRIEILRRTRIANVTAGL